MNKPLRFQEDYAPVYIMLYLHRNVIKAAVTGEEMLKAPKSCPAFRAKDDE